MSDRDAAAPQIVSPAHDRSRRSALGASTKHAKFDIVLVGGGLQNALIALASLRAQPSLRIAMLERQASVGGNHTWCFHAGDVSPSLSSLVDEIAEFRWDGYSVRFPGSQRTFDDPYAGISSQRLASAVEKAFDRAEGSALLCGVTARAVHARGVELDDGTLLAADLVVDSRGPGHHPQSNTGFQTFLGLELELTRPHGLERPILMDATVPQVGGFRFVYVLPLAPDRVLVEDTLFGRSPTLQPEQRERACLNFAQASGFELARVRRTESGCLAMPWHTRLPAPSAPLRAGYQGGWFHPATGYSFPIAARLAAFIAARSPKHVVGPALRALWATHMRCCRSLLSAGG